MLRQKESCINLISVLLYLWCEGVSIICFPVTGYRATFIRTHANIEDGAFCKNSYRLKPMNCFCKKLHMVAGVLNASLGQ